MSSILKALKKLEEQKAPRPQYELDLSSGIMRERKAGRHRRWAIPAGMAAIAIVAAFTTYALMALHHKTETMQRQPEVASTTASPVPPQPTATLLPPAGIPTAASSQQADAIRSAAARSATAATPVKSKPALPPARQQPKNEPPPRQVPSAAIAEIPAAPPAAYSPPPARSDRIPDLKLSGIAWQKDSASRYAVVNGIAVSEGSTIEGVRIEEILPDKVRFSMGSRSFEVPMGHISPTN